MEIMLCRKSLPVSICLLSNQGKKDLIREKINTITHKQKIIKLFYTPLPMFHKELLYDSTITTTSQRQVRIFLNTSAKICYERETFR